MKLSARADRTTLQLVLAPGLQATPQNGLAAAWLEQLRSTLDQHVAVDHGHKKSTGETCVGVTLRPIPETKKQAANEKEDVNEQEESGDDNEAGKVEAGQQHWGTVLAPGTPTSAAFWHLPSSRANYTTLAAQNEACTEQENTKHAKEET